MNLGNLFLKIKLDAKYRLSKKITLEKKNQPTAYVFLAANYANLGDVAITESQRNFLQQVLGELYTVELVFFSEKMGKLKTIINNLKSDDVVTIIGGGNFGNRYNYIEYLRQLIVKKIKHNKIFLFPQTMDFSDSVSGRRELELAKKIYKGNIVMCAREKKSAQLMKNSFEDIEVLFVPDIVLSELIYDTSLQIKDRDDKLGFCLRDDGEKSLDFDVKEFISNHFEQLDTINRDTHVIDTGQNYNELVKELNRILNDFSTYKLVITDRLHGMIFCYLTETPCLFFDNSNKKVSGVFEWIKKSNFIKQTNSENLIEDIKEFLELKEKVKFSPIESFEPLVKLLKENS